MKNGFYNLNAIKKITHIVKRFKEKFINSNIEINTIKVINFQVNNFCNSRCVMCNIWKQKDIDYVDLKTFEKILKDDLFKNVEHIGITGGEPTLIPNISDYFSIAIRSIPCLKGLSLITNALSTEKVKLAIKNINDMCRNSSINFSVMISLDGLEDVHDRNRGIHGNFEKSMVIIGWLKENNIPFSVGTTITKINVWDMDKFLLFLRNFNIMGRFRIAEFINRLYNSEKDNKNVIRNFDEDEKYQLLLFFSKLEYAYENDQTVKNTYRSIRNMLEGGKRLVECPYKNGEAINLNCHGEISYCAPKSPIIGSILFNKGKDIYIRNIKKLNRIKKLYCNNCIHDYHSVPTEELIKNIENEEHYRKLISIQAYNEKKDEIKLSFSHSMPNSKRIFIIGWYGTETVGDKAILGGIIDHYKRINNNKIEFYISSLYPFVTKRTIYELNIKANVIPVYSEEFFKCAANSSEIVVGGGPLMELEELALIEWAFKLAKQNNKTTTIFGCGIGPLYSVDKINAVKEILDLSDNIYLRDYDSIEYAKKLVNSYKTIEYIDDPSRNYILGLSTQIHTEKVPKKLSCFLRELTYEYKGNMIYEEFISFKSKFEKALADNIINLCKATGMKPYFYSMHNFVIGNDDRDFNYKFTMKYFKNVDHYVENKLSSVNSIIEAVKSSQLNLCMRFHSVVFADTLNTNYIAIDYTSGGKIKSYKKIESPVAGDADVLVAPDIEAGNILYKSVIDLGGAKGAGLVMGAAAPVVLTSRADSAATKKASIALAVLVSSAGRF